MSSRNAQAAQAAQAHAASVIEALAAGHAEPSSFFSMLQREAYPPPNALAEITLAALSACQSFDAMLSGACSASLQTRRGALVSSAHVLRAYESNISAEDGGPPRGSSAAALAAALRALDVAAERSGRPLSVYMKRSVVLERVAQRRETGDWRQSDAELHFLSSLAHLGFGGWGHSLEPSGLLCAALPGHTWAKLLRSNGAAAASEAAATSATADWIHILPTRRLRVGFASAHFGPSTHVLSLLQRASYELDRRHFEVYVFSLSPAHQQVREHVVSRLDSPSRFVDLHNASVGQAVEAIASRGIHLLLWVSEPNHAMRAVLSRRPAPISTFHLTFPGTSGGVQWPEYITFDRVTMPPHRAAASERQAGRAWATERLLLMPAHYQVNSHWYTFTAHYAGGSTKAMRQRYLPAGFRRGLPGLHSRTWWWVRPTIANFGVAQKLEPLLFDVLRHAMLRRRAQLWMYGGQRAAPAALADELRARGVLGRRLIAAPRVDAPDLMARATRATVYADSISYNSHTMMVDMGWATLPGVTARGGSTASRVGSAVAAANGVPESTVDSLKAYADALDLGLVWDGSGG